MTPQTQHTCLEILAGMLSPTQVWTEPTGQLFAYVMQNWSDDIALDAVRHAATHEQFRPSPATLRQIAARLSAESASPLPSLSQVRSEVRRLIAYHGERAGKAAHSHPIIAAVVEEFGDWYSLGRMSSDEVDNGFAGAYDRAVKHLHDEIAATMLHLPASERQGKLMLCARRREIPASRIINEKVPETAGTGTG